MSPSLPPSCPATKRRLARLAARTPLVRASRAAERALGASRVLNYHGTPPRLSEAFARQVDHLLSRYDAASPFELESLVAGSPARRPRVLFTFDDGLANNADVAARVLEARGVRAIFCVPLAFPDVPRAAQPAWFRAHVRPERNAEHDGDEDLLAMPWESVRALARRGHRIASHTISHPVITAATSEADLEVEIRGSRRLLEAKLPGVAVDGFCWPVAFDEAAAAAEAHVRDAYAYALLGGSGFHRGSGDAYRVGRVNLEASWPLEVVDLQLSFLLDAKHALSRRASAGAPP